MNFLFHIYPLSHHNTKTGKKFLKTDYGSDFDICKMQEVFSQLRGLSAKEMVKRNQNRKIDGNVHLSITLWSQHGS